MNHTRTNVEGRPQQNDDLRGEGTLNIELVGDGRGFGYTAITHSAITDERLGPVSLAVFVLLWQQATYDGTINLTAVEERFGKERVDRAPGRQLLNLCSGQWPERLVVASRYPTESWPLQGRGRKESPGQLKCPG